MWPTFCLACPIRALLFKFLAIGSKGSSVGSLRRSLIIFGPEPYFFKYLDTGLDFSGSSVELLANSGRRHGGGKAESKWIRTVIVNS